MCRSQLVSGLQLPASRGALGADTTYVFQGHGQLPTQCFLCLMRDELGFPGDPTELGFPGDPTGHGILQGPAFREILEWNDSHDLSLSMFATR